MGGILKKNLTGPDWVNLMESITQWEKSDHITHSADWLLELNQQVKEGPPPFPKGPNQRKYYEAYYFVKDWIKGWEFSQIFDNQLGRSSFHHRQLQKLYNPEHRGKVRFRNEDLNKYSVLQWYQWDPYLGNDQWDDDVPTFLILSDKEGRDVKLLFQWIDERTFCPECGDLRLIIIDKRREWVCPGCGLVERSIHMVPGDKQLHPTYWEPRNARSRRAWKDTPNNYQKISFLINRKAEYDPKRKHQKNKESQASILNLTYIKEGLNLKDYQIIEIKKHIDRLDYRKLGGNRALKDDIKTVYIALYVLEKEGKIFRIGRNKFLKSLGLTNDNYKRVKAKIDEQLPD